MVSELELAEVGREAYQIGLDLQIGKRFSLIEAVCSYCTSGHY